VALNGSQSADVPLLSDSGTEWLTVADVPLLSDSGTEWLTVADVPLRNYLLTA